MRTVNEIMLEFSKLPCNKKVDILINALDEMQSYSGRSKMTCIALAMGYETTWCDNDNVLKFIK